MYTSDSRKKRKVCARCVSRWERGSGYVSMSFVVLFKFKFLTTNRSWFFDDVFENEIEPLIEDHAHSKYNLYVPQKLTKLVHKKILRGLTVCRSLRKRANVVKPTKMKIGSRLNHANSIPNKSPVGGEE